MDVTYRYAARGVPAAVMEEARRSNHLWNRLTEIERDYEDAVRASWEDHPQAGPVLTAASAAKQAVQDARDAVAAAKQKAGFARSRGRPKAVIASADQAVKDAREAYREARENARDAASAVKEAKARYWDQARLDISAAARARDEAVKATYDWFRDDLGGYWGTWLDVTAHHRKARDRVRDARRQGRPAGLRLHRFEGGTATVMLQREQPLTQADRDEVERLRAEGKTSTQIGELTGRTAMAVALMKPEGPEKPGDPRRSPEVLASGEGKWASQLTVSPVLPGDFADRPRSERRAIARTGSVSIRTGSAACRTVSQVPVTLHRPLPPDADVTLGRFTVTKCGPDWEGSLALSVRTAGPVTRRGGLTGVHAGWRTLPAGSVRVAVCTVPSPLPERLARYGCVRMHGDWAEIVFPAAWRADLDAVEKLSSARALGRDKITDAVREWLAGHPGIEGLPSPADVARWRSPARLVVLGRRCGGGEHGDAALELGDLIAGWAHLAPGAEAGRRWKRADLALSAVMVADGLVPDEQAWRREARARRKIIRRRDDAWRNVAAWLAGPGTGEIRSDGWDLPALARRPGPVTDDDPQAVAARAARQAAAPGELRAAVAWAAARRGVAVREPDASPPQVHWSCGVMLDADARRLRVVVECPGCGQRVDQDENMLRLLLTA